MTFKSIIFSGIFLFSLVNLATAETAQGTIKNLMTNNNGNVILSVEVSTNTYTWVWIPNSNKSMIAAAFSAKSDGATIWVRYTINTGNTGSDGGCTDYQGAIGGNDYSPYGWICNQARFLETRR